MSTDIFEDELRSLLHAAADAEEHALAEVDSQAVLTRGRRVVRRRRLATGAGIAAAVVALGAVGVTTLGDGADRTSAPAATTSARPQGAVTVVLDPFSGLTDATTGAELSIPGPRQVAVTVDPHRTPDLVYWDVAENGSRSMLGGSSLDGIPQLAATWGTAGADSHVLVGVLPAQAVQFQLVTPLTDEGGHASTTVTSPLPGTGRQAFAVRFAEAGDADSVRHLLWWGEDGTVHDETGAVVPSVALGDDEGTTVFVAESLDRLGTFSRQGGASMMRLDAARNTSGRPVLSTARGEGDRLAGLFVAVVPASATPGRLTPNAGTTVTRQLTKATLPGSGSAVLWATYTAPKVASGADYRSVTWTEAGRPVTERP